MGARTAIEWTDATWNPFQGCTKVDRDCLNCYMYRDKERYGDDPTVVVRSKPGTFNGPLNRTKYPPGSLIFTASWSDWGHPAAEPHVPDAWRVVAQREDATFQVLTKRPERLPLILPAGWGEGWSNVWLGTSVGSAKGAHRARILADVPAAVRFLSLEPLWGPGVADAIAEVVLAGRIDWLIVGGESGPKARPMHPAWAREVIALAQQAGVPLLFKQWGEWLPACELRPEIEPSLYRSNRVAKPGQDQAELDDAYGRTCRVDQQVLRYDGVHRELRDPQAFNSDVPGWPAMLAFKIGKHQAGRTIDGVVHDGYPTPRPGVRPCLPS